MMITASRKTVSATVSKTNPTSEPSMQTPPGTTRISALTTTKISDLASSGHLAGHAERESRKAAALKSAMAAPKRGPSESPEASPDDKIGRKNKRVTISNYVEYEEGQYEDDEGDYGDDEGDYGDDEGYDYDEDEEGYEGGEGYEEDWDEYEDYEDYDEEYEDEYDDEDYESEESEGWNTFDPWFLWNDLDGSRMANNFKAFHALNRDMAPERLRKKINPCPYAIPFVIKKEASCPMLFEDFLELPDNIRETIWEYALPQQSRVVAIYQHSGAYVKCAGPDVYTTQGFGGKRPVLLRVNHEAREVAKRFYKLAFSAVDGKPKYFNFSLDALHLWGVDPDFVERMPFIKDDLAKVQKLAIHGAGLMADEDQYARLRHFSSLKTLLIEKPNDQIDATAKEKFYDKFKMAASQLATQITAQQAQATASARSNVTIEDISKNMQVEEVAKADSVSSATLFENSTVQVAAPDDNIEEMPEVGTLIDQAIADMSMDVDTLIDEAMVDISFANDVHVKPPKVPNEQTTTELVIDFRTFMYTCSKVKRPIDGINPSVAGGKAGEPTLSADSNIDLDSEDNNTVAAPSFGDAGTASAHLLALSSKENGDVNSDSNELSAAKVTDALASEVDGAGVHEPFVVVWQKAEEILEIAIIPSQWPKRVNNAKKFWKWNMAKRRADDIWGTGVYSNQVPNYYGPQPPFIFEDPAPPLSPRAAAARAIAELNNPLAVRRLQEVAKSSLCCTCSSRAPEASNNHTSPVGPLQGSDGDYLPVGHLAPAEVKTAVNAIIANAINPSQYTSPYKSPDTTQNIAPQHAEHLVGGASRRPAPRTTQGSAFAGGISGNTSRGMSSFTEFGFVATDHRGFPQPPAPYISPYASVAPAVSGTYTHDGPDPIRYVSPYGPPSASGAGGSFGVIRFGNHGRSGSAGGSSNGGNKGPVAGPIPTPRYTPKAMGNTGGGTAYYVSNSSREASRDRGGSAARASSSAPRGGFGQGGTGLGQGSIAHGSSLVPVDDDTDTDEEIL